MKKDNFFEEISIIIVTYKSSNILVNFLEKINDKFKVIIIDNSNDLKLKDLLKRFHNVSLYFHKNNGFATSVNYAVSKIKTKYFFQISPDLELNFENLKLFYDFAKSINDNFTAMGPHFTNVNPKSHKQSNKNEEIVKMKFIHGSALFINLEKFKLIGKFDENFFLYFEETDYCKRGNDLGIPSYQLNRIIVKSIGRTVETGNEIFKQKLDILTTWHFIWSKFYYFRKNYGYIFSILYFLPTLIRIIFRINLYKILKQKIKTKKYIYRLDGLLKSIRKKKSHLRIEDI